MTSKGGVVCVLVFLTGLICQQSYCLNSHDPDRSLSHQADLGALGYQHHQQQLPNQRPTQFISSPQASLSQQGVNAREALIMPPNNHQIQVNNFHTFNHPSSKYQPTSSALVTTELSQSNNKLHRSEENINNISQTAHSPNQDRSISNSNMRTSFANNIELALRQANSDENVFQPSSTIGFPDQNNFDWLGSSTLSSSSLQTINQQPTIDQKRYGEQEPQQQQARDGIEHSNNIVQNDNIGVSTFAPEVNEDHSQQRQQQSHEVQKLGHQDEYPLLANSPTQLTNQTSGLQANIELNNHVFYEGPATAPPAGDYYFSSAEKLPNNNERLSNAWCCFHCRHCRPYMSITLTPFYNQTTFNRALGFGNEFERVSNLTGADYLDYCAKSELLVSNKQRSLCRSHPKIMPIVSRGLKMAIDECQFRFTSNRWNCSIVLHDSIQLDSSRSQVFGDVMKHPNRERSFLNAIIAAGLAHAMTKACSQGELPEECSCDKRIRSKNNKGKIEWVACSDDIDFGARFSRDFTDNTENDDSDTTPMINTHNYEVGRRVFKSATDITCTCQNGENGLCQTKRCWKHLSPFTDVGDELMKRYEGATHVQLSNKDPHKLRPVRRGVRKPRRKDLVYIDESPDYCSADTRLGVLGTQNRRCNSTSLGPDSCSLLCCGRGYQMVVEEIEEDCNCKFVWCCQVKCDKCKRHITNDVCN